MTKTTDIAIDYVNRVYQVVRVLREHFKVQDVLRAKRDRLIPARGFIDDYELSYTFHGVGCAAEANGVVIDFDFGPNGIVGGFDSWRLYKFVKSCDDYDSSQFTQERLEADLQALIESGVVLAPKQEPSPHLLYLAKSMET